MSGDNMDSHVSDIDLLESQPPKLQQGSGAPKYTLTSSYTQLGADLPSTPSTPIKYPPYTSTPIGLATDRGIYIPKNADDFGDYLPENLKDASNYVVPALSTPANAATPSTFQSPFKVPVTPSPRHSTKSTAMSSVRAVPNNKIAALPKSDQGQDPQDQSMTGMEVVKRGSSTFSNPPSEKAANRVREAENLVLRDPRAEKMARQAKDAERMAKFLAETDPANKPKTQFMTPQQKPASGPTKPLSEYNELERKHEQVVKDWKSDKAMVDKLERRLENCKVDCQGAHNQAEQLQRDLDGANQGRVDADKLRGAADERASRAEAALEKAKEDASKSDATQQQVDQFRVKYEEAQKLCNDRGSSLIDLRGRYNSLETESNDLRKQLTDMTAQRDRAVRRADAAEVEARQTKDDNNILRSNYNDLRSAGTRQIGELQSTNTSYKLEAAHALGAWQQAEANYMDENKRLKSELEEAISQVTSHQANNSAAIAPTSSGIEEVSLTEAEFEAELNKPFDDEEPEYEPQLEQGGGASIESPDPSANTCPVPAHADLEKQLNEARVAYNSLKKEASNCEERLQTEIDNLREELDDEKFYSTGQPAAPSKPEEDTTPKTGAQMLEIMGNNLNPVLADNNRKLEAEKKAIVEELGECRGQLQSAEEKANGLQSELDAKSLEVGAAGTTIIELQSELETAGNTIIDLRSDLGTAKSKIVGLEHESASDLKFMGQVLGLAPSWYTRNGIYLTIKDLQGKLANATKISNVVAGADASIAGLGTPSASTSPASQGNDYGSEKKARRDARGAMLAARRSSAQQVVSSASIPGPVGSSDTVLAEASPPSPPAATDAAAVISTATTPSTNSDLGQSNSPDTIPTELESVLVQPPTSISSETDQSTGSDLGLQESAPVHTLPAKAESLQVPEVEAPIVSPSPISRRSTRRPVFFTEDKATITAKNRISNVEKRIQDAVKTTQTEFMFGLNAPRSYLYINWSADELVKQDHTIDKLKRDQYLLHYLAKDPFESTEYIAISDEEQAAIRADRQELTDLKVHNATCVRYMGDLELEVAKYRDEVVIVKKDVSVELAAAKAEAETMKENWKDAEGRIVNIYRSMLYAPSSYTMACVSSWKEKNGRSWWNLTKLTFGFQMHKALDPIVNPIKPFLPSLGVAAFFGYLACGVYWDRYGTHQ